MNELMMNRPWIINNPFLKRRTKKNGFGLQLDALGWTIVVLIIAAIVLLAVFELRNAARIAGTKLEMSQIEDAIVQYEGLRNDGRNLDSLDTLLQDPCIQASNAIDSVDHNALLPSTNNRWANGSIVDMWGTAYEYSYDATTQVHTLTSTGSGNDITINF